MRAVRTKSKSKSTQSKRVDIDPKVYQSLKRDVLAELKKVASESKTAVLVAFDKEEEIADRFVTPIHDTITIKNDSEVDLESFINQLPHCDSLLPSTLGAVSWDEVLKSSLCLFTYKSFLQLPGTTTLPEFLQMIIDTSAEINPIPHLQLHNQIDETQFLNEIKYQSTVSIPQNCESDLISAVMTRATQGMELDEAEWDERDAMNAPQLLTSTSIQSNSTDEALVSLNLNESETMQQRRLEAIATLDRVNLRLARIVCDLVSKLYDSDPNEVSTQIQPADKKKKTGPPPSFPLNQMTWPDIVRMGILNILLREMDKNDESIQRDRILATLKGSRPQQSSRSVIRMIRYKLLLRSFRSESITDTISPSESNNLHIRVFKLLSRLDSSCNPTIDGLLLISLSNALKSSKALKFLDIPAIAHNIALIDDSLAPRIDTTAAVDTISFFFGSDELDDGDEDGAGGNKFDGKFLDKVLSRIREVEDSGVLGRCAQVFLRVASFSAAKHFFWEIDPVNEPEYHQTLACPLVLSTVAMRILTGYYTNESETEMEVALRFYLDMRRVFLCAAVYQTELSVSTGQATKLLHVLARHMDCWVFSENRAPNTVMCNDSYCVLSHTIIPTPNPSEPGAIYSIRCSKCSSVISLDSLSNSASGDSKYSQFIFQPSLEQLKSIHEEWFCPLCLSEDSITHKPCEQLSPIFESHNQTDTNSKSMSFDSNNKTRNSVMFHFNEWGVSTTIPWQLHEGLSLVPARLREEYTSYEVLYEALGVLCNSHLSGVVSYHSYEEGCNSIVQLWTANERITVMSAVCEVMRASPVSYAHLVDISKQFDALNSICSRGAFREADLTDVVESIMGSDGKALCRALLDGAENDDWEKQQIKTAPGRCAVCKHSTYEDECGEEQILLCNGCNSEGHLSCTGLTTGTRKAWYCPPCAEVGASKDKKHSRSAESIDLHRDKEHEEHLIDLATRRKAGDNQGMDNDPYLNVECAYCGLTEFGLCSPLVPAQSREEHDWALQMCEKPSSDEPLPGKSRCARVAFVINGMRQAPPSLTTPYFPPVRSKHGRALLEISPNMNLVHEQCALQMFKARLDRSRHTLRRKRCQITDRIIEMSGVKCQPLGTDRHGREYWKIPGSPHLFICTKSLSLHEVECKAELASSLGYSNSVTVSVDSSPKVVSKSTAVWKVVSDKAVVRSLVALLGGSSDPRDRLLLQAIASAVLDDHTRNSMPDSVNISVIAKDSQSEPEPTTAATVGDTEVAVVESKTNEAEGCATSSDGTATESESMALQINSEPSRPKRVSIPPKDKMTTMPVEVVATIVDKIELKLLTDKGPDVASSYLIKEEIINAPEAEDDSADDAVGTAYRQYFDFGKKYFAVALVNQHGKKQKFSKGSVTVTYQIYLAGKRLSYTPLTDPWTDSIYYFSTLTFRQSGEYEISFSAVGESIGNVEPLIFPVIVTAKSVVCGPSAALRQLIARTYLDSSGRQITLGRRSLLEGTHSADTELLALKSAIRIVYAALPFGSLPHAVEPPVGSDIVQTLANSEEWSESLDQAWRGSVESASDPLELMECFLLLEHCINRSWIKPAATRLTSRLPHPHFAVRCCTYSAVALRVFCLDRSLDYDKIYVPPRNSRRSGENTSLSVGSISRSKLNQSQLLPRMNIPVESRRERKAAQQYSENDDDNASADDVKNDPNVGDDDIEHDADADDDDDDDDDENDYVYDDDDDDLGMGRRSRRTATRQQSTSSSRHRDGSRSDTGARATSRKRNTRSWGDDDVDDTDEIDGWVEEPRHTNRKVNRVSYAELENSDIDEFEDPSPATSNRRDNANVNANAMTLTENLGVGEAIDIDEEIGKLKAGRTDITGQKQTEFKLWCYELLKILNADQQTLIFWVPVSGVRGYSKIIKRPMDLGTIAQRVRDDVYASGRGLDNFIGDVRLVWRNCKTFNEQQSYLHNVAIRLEAQCEKYFLTFRNQDNQSNEAESMEGEQMQDEIVRENEVTDAADVTEEVEPEVEYDEDYQSEEEENPHDVDADSNEEWNGTSEF